MTISELRLTLDLSFDSKVEILKQHAKQMLDGNYLFVDSSNGEFYLFDRNGNEDDIAKLDCIETDLFNGDENLNLIKIPTSIISIGNWAFAWSRILKSVTIPGSVTSISDHVFSRCTELTSVTIGAGVTDIGNYAFNCCRGLKSVMIPDSVENIRSHAFEDCIGLTNVTIPDSVTSIGGYAFNSCSELTSVTIPDRVTNIGHMAFYNCINLKKLVFKGTTIDEIKSMDNYPWGIKDESIIKCES